MGNVITGTDLAIDVGKNYKGKLNIYGKTEQKTRSGKNLLNVTAKTGTTQGITFTVNADKSITINGTNTGTETAFFRLADNFVLSAGDYTLSNKNANVSNGSFIFYDDGNNFPRTNISNATFTKDTTIKPYIKITPGQTVNNQTVYPMIIKGTYTEETLPPYEQYGAMPSPEFPSPIENVEGKNIWNKSEISEKTSTVNMNVGELNVKDVPIPFTFSSYLISNALTDTNVRVSFADSNNSNIGAVKYGNTVTSTNKRSSITINEIPEGTVKIRFGIRLQDGGHTEKTQLEEGTVATPYVPYNSLEFEVEGKNLFDKTKFKAINRATYTYSNGIYAITPLGTGNVSLDIYINLPAGIYTYSGNGSNATQVKNSSGATIANNVSSSNTTFTITEEGTYIRFNWGTGTSTDAFTLDTNNIQIESGSTATDYEPYKSQVVTFPLGEEKLMEGSYLADDGIHHRRKQYVITGQENWNEYTASGEYSDDLHCYFGLNDVILNSKMAIKSSICTHFKNPGTWVIVPSIAQYGTYQDNPNVRHRYFITNISTLAKWKKWLSDQYANGTPVILEYELSEEEIVPYTAEQQEAWNEMQDIYLYEGKNYINFIGTLKPELELEYLKIVDDCDFYVSENGHLVIPEHGIDYLIDLNASNIPSMPEAVEASVRIVGKDGDVTLNTTYEPMNFSIVCYTDDNLTPQEKVAEEQKINRFIDSMKNETKVFAIEKDEKFYEVKYNGVLTTVRFPAHIQFTIPIKSSESYAMDLIKKRIKGNNSENSNTIKDVGAIFTILGPAQTPKISFNNYEMFYDNVLLENTKLVIDSNKSTVTHVNGVTGKKTNAMRYYNHQFPKVKFGENILVVNSGIDDASQVKVEWNDLKL